MAMSSTDIQRARELLDKMNSYINNCSDINFKSLGINQAQFERFLSSTKGGRDFLNKYNSLIDCENDTHEIIHEINDSVREFLDEQERVNS